MARDIEEFLRRAAERRQQQQQGGLPAAQPVQDILDNEDIEVLQPAPIPRSGRAAETSRPRRGGAKKNPVQAPQRESVARHVQQHIKPASISQHSAHLGQQVASADDRMAARLQQRFSNDLTKLDDFPTARHEEVASVTKQSYSVIAQDLANIMRDNTNLRQAILMAEILNRPNFD